MPARARTRAAHRRCPRAGPRAAAPPARVACRPGSGRCRPASGRGRPPCARCRPGRGRRRGRRHPPRSRSGATPSGVLPVSAYQAFQPSTQGSVAASILGPLEPTISGGPPGRAGRGSSSASRAVKYSPSKSIEPSASSVRTIVNASSKREIRWSNGAPSAANSDVVPAGAQAQHQPAAGDLVHRRRLLGEHERRVERGRGDERPDRHALGGLGERRRASSTPPTARARAGRVPVQQMVADPDRVEARLLGRPRDRAQLRPADLALHLGQLDADPERTPWEARNRAVRHGATLPHPGDPAD